MKGATPRQAKTSSAGQPATFGCPKPIYAIVNAQKSPKARGDLWRRLSDLGATVVYTTYPGHAVELARQATSFRTLVAVGGDGTVSEVATGMDLSTHYLAVIPTGAANCIARAMGIRTAEAGFRTLTSGSICQADVMESAFVDSHHKRQGRRFVGFLACGHEGEITRRAAAWKKLPAPLRTAAAAVVSTASLRSLKVRLTVDTEEERETVLTSLLVNNCGAESCTSPPPWDMCDGTLETLVSRRGPLAQFFSNFRRVVKTRPSKNWRTGVTKLACRFDTPGTLLADGEVYTDITTLALAVAAKKLRLIAPYNRPLKYKAS